MSFIAPIFLVILLFMLFFQESSKEKKIEKFKEFISQKGELLRFYSNIDFFDGTHGNDYIVFYRDKNAKLHRCKVYFHLEFKITQDKIVPDEEEMTGYNNFSKPTPKSEPIIVEERKISTEDGEMCIQLTSVDIVVGNKVFLNNSPAPDGKYKIGFLHYIYVKDGRIC